MRSKRAAVATGTGTLSSKFGTGPQGAPAMHSESEAPHALTILISATAA